MAQPSTTPQLIRMAVATFGLVTPDSHHQTLSSTASFLFWRSMNASTFFKRIMVSQIGTSILLATMMARPPRTALIDISRMVSILIR